MSSHAALLHSRLVRYADLRGCRNAFVDSRTPGSERKENFTIIGPGVAENPDQHVHVAIPHGFNIGAARQPPRCVNSQHSHETAEVFVVLTGTWAFRSGDRSQDGEVVVRPGDVISLPTHMFRGFENIGTEDGFMFAVLGGDDPGRVTWAPYVFEAARNYGLILLEGGQLIDTTLGQTVPPGASQLRPTSQADVDRLRRYSSADLRRCVCAVADMVPSASSSLTTHAAGVVDESPVIGAASAAEGLPAAPLGGDTGFHMRCVTFAPGASVPAHSRAEEEVWLMFSGQLDVWVGDDRFTLGTGDVFSVPTQMRRGVRNASAAPAIAYVVRGGDHPSAPTW
jgi:quercetin dioxygenase-like cupin family protein